MTTGPFAGAVLEGRLRSTGTSLRISKSPNHETSCELVVSWVFVKLVSARSIGSNKVSISNNKINVELRCRGDMPCLISCKRIGRLIEHV